VYRKLLKTVTNLGRPEVLVAGDFMLDVYSYGDAVRISPEAPVPVLKVTESEYRCGGAASVALDLAVLGARVRCVGVVGDDPNGSVLVELLKAGGADVTGLLVVPGRTTTTKRRLIGLAQHRHRQQLIRMDEETTDPVPRSHMERVAASFTQALPDCKAVCLQDYDKGMLTAEVCGKFVAAARRAGKLVLIDPAAGVDYAKYRNATLISPNRSEASAAAGLEIDSPCAAACAAARLTAGLNLDAVVITLDRDGAYLKAGEIDELVPTKARSVYDVTGAGDTVLAMLAMSLAAGADYREAVRLANIVGGIEVEKFGAAPISIEEIINEIVAADGGKKGKILSAEALLCELDWRRARRQRIVFTNGCFDIVHTGHIEFLKYCKQQADVVVVGLNSDNSVRAIKGPDRPINNQLDRSAVLSALEAVDYIVIFDEPDPLKLIEAVRPDVLVKGRDWAEKGVVGGDFVKSYGGRVVLAPLVEGKSTTTVIDKIRADGGSVPLNESRGGDV
jgi:D-beta-D-heptose 7-phosphate kinase/D-beta-D-heptose 1-phosphate adenosyltransferase